MQILAFDSLIQMHDSLLCGTIANITSYVSDIKPTCIKYTKTRDFSALNTIVPLDVFYDKF